MDAPLTNAPTSRRPNVQTSIVLFLFALAGCHDDRAHTSATWASLIAPYAPGREVVHGYVLGAPARSGAVGVRAHAALSK